MHPCEVLAETANSLTWHAAACRYSTGPNVSGSDALIQDYYSHQCSNPVHLTVDTGLSGGRLAVTAYVARTLTLGGRPEPLATQFQEVACEIQTVAVEKIGSAHTQSCPILGAARRRRCRLHFSGQAAAFLSGAYCLIGGQQLPSAGLQRPNYRPGAGCPKALCLVSVSTSSPALLSPLRYGMLMPYYAYLRSGAADQADDGEAAVGCGGPAGVLRKAGVGARSDGSLRRRCRGVQQIVLPLLVKACLSICRSPSAQHGDGCFAKNVWVLRAEASQFCDSSAVLGTTPHAHCSCAGAQAGRRKGDRTIGRFLADTVDAVPLVSREDLEVLFNQNVQVSLCCAPACRLQHLHLT